MGCFSFFCKECDEPVNSTCDEGELVKLFLFEDHKVIQELEGEYDAYGSVFKRLGPLKIPHKWKMSWDKVCDLMHKGRETYNPYPEKRMQLITELLEVGLTPEGARHILEELDELVDDHSWVPPEKPGTGIAAVHSSCFKEVPTTPSKSDPNQGSGKIKAAHKRKK